MSWHTAPSFLLLGHRGARLDAPENTLPALEIALEQGADGIEFDVQLSADGVPVVIHDWSVDRTTDGTGAVADLTVAELQALDAGEGASIPTLDKVFARFGAGIFYNVELKTMAADSSELEVAVARSIMRHGIGDRVLVSSFNPRALDRLHAQAPKVALGFLHAGPGSVMLPEAPLLAVHPHHELVDDGYCAWAAEQECRIHVWTVNDGARARALRARGIQAIISDDPRTLIRALSQPE